MCWKQYLLPLFFQINIYIHNLCVRCYFTFLVPLTAAGVLYLVLLKLWRDSVRTFLLTYQKYHFVVWLNGVMVSHRITFCISHLLQPVAGVVGSLRPGMGGRPFVYLLRSSAPWKQHNPLRGNTVFTVYAFESNCKHSLVEWIVIFTSFELWTLQTEVLVTEVVKSMWISHGLTAGVSSKPLYTQGILMKQASTRFNTVPRSTVS